MKTTTLAVIAAAALVSGTLVLGDPGPPRPVAPPTLELELLSVRGNLQQDTIEYALRLIWEPGDTINRPPPIRYFTRIIDDAARTDTLARGETTALEDTLVVRLAGSDSLTVYAAAASFALNGLQSETWAISSTILLVPPLFDVPPAPPTNVRLDTIPVMPPPPDDFQLEILDVATGAAYQVRPAIFEEDSVYIDRSFLFASLNEPLEGSPGIRTANADKNVMADPLLTLHINRAATVYVAHDDRVIPRPTWLEGWLDTGFDIFNTDGPEPYSLFSQDYPAGEVALGPNAAVVNTRTSMYTVIVVPVPLVGNVSLIPDSLTVIGSFAHQLNGDYGIEVRDTMSWAGVFWKDGQPVGCCRRHYWFLADRVHCAISRICTEHGY